ncbi:hypothetical protein D3C73_1652180 [compost metagenome]
MGDGEVFQPFHEEKVGKTFRRTEPDHAAQQAAAFGNIRLQSFRFRLDALDGIDQPPPDRG